MTVTSNNIIPNGAQLGVITKYYLINILFMILISGIKSNTYTQIIDNLILESPINIMSVTLVLMLWHLLHKYNTARSLFIYSILLLIPPVCYKISTWLYSSDTTIQQYSQLCVFSVLSYTFSYLEYYKYYAMLPIRNTAFLNSLQNKLKPHFLFNALNSILGVIRDDTRLAEHLLEELSDLFRSLASDDRLEYTFKEDLDLTLKYLDIENIRMGHKLNLITEIEPDTLNVMVPFLLLQPLVENSILYGVTNKNNNGLLYISSKKVGTYINITVVNKYLTKSESKGTGTALSNLKTRLYIMYDVDALITTSIDDDMFKIIIRIPDR